MKKALFFFTFIFAIIAACQKDKLVWEEVYFEFEMPFTITSGSDSIHVGDTLTMEAAFSDSLFDRKSQKKIYLPAFNFFHLFACHELKDNSIYLLNQQGGLGKFSVINSIGSFIVTSNQHAKANFAYTNGQYEMKVQLVPKEKGVYAIIFYPYNPDGFGPISLPQSLAPNSPGVKRFPVIQFTRYVFNKGKTHQNIFVQHCRQFNFTDSVSPIYASESIYTFVVK